MSIRISRVASNKEYEACLSIRRKVFIEEQGISESIEMDDDRIDATNFIALLDDYFAGTARYQNTSHGIKLERFAVLRSYRNLGIGKALVKFMLDTIHGDEEIYLHAQEAVVKFYLPLGFKKIGERFFEAGIPHWKMVKK